ncbi:phage tail tape measure protein [Labilibacter sediminis]|nr:phage tail tape measure protein [Labilibacter sediminis]
MAQNSTYTRRINLYINGKEVKNDVKSIRGEMQKLIFAQSKMTIGSDKYVATGKKIQALNAVLKQHKQQLYSTATGWGSLSGAANKFNQYFGMISAGIASLTGVVFGFRKAADAFNTFEERLDNLSALTGLEGDQLEWLGEQAKKSSVKVTEAGIKIKQGASDILDAYTMVGSQRPELLKNKEALAQVTENAIILSEAAKSKLAPATEALTNTMNQFNLSADDSERVINILAAGSKEGAANVPYLSQAIEKMGTTFALMGGDVEQAVGMIEAVAPKFKKAEIAGNSLDKVLLKMKGKQIGYKDGVFDVNQALLELEARFKKGESATSIFGEEHAKMVEVLVQARTEMNRYTEAVTGTDIATEQARKNTNNRAAELAQAKNRVQLLAIELGEKLSPAMTKSILGFSTLLKVAIKLPQIIKENKTLLIALTGALLAYNAGLITSIALQTKDKAIRLASMVIEKGQMTLRAAHVLGLKAWIAVTGKATMAQKRWMVSMKQMGVAMSANPLGIIIASLTALYLALKTYDRYNANAIQREKEKRSATEKLSKANNNLKESYDEISKQIENISRLSIQEKNDLREKTKLTLQQAMAELQLQKQKRESLYNSNRELNSFQKIQKSFLEKMADFSSNPYISRAVEEMAKSWENENATEAVKEYDDQLKQLQQTYASLQNQYNGLTEIMDAEQLGDDIGIETLANLEEKLGNYQVALKHAARGGEDYVRIQKKIAAVQKEMDKFAPSVSTAGDDKDAEKKVKDLANKKEQAEKKLADATLRIRRQLHLDTLSDEAKELQAIKDKYADLYNVAVEYGIDTTELVDLQNKEIEAKQAEHNKKQAELKREIEEELAQMYRSDFEREKQAKIKQYEELLKLAEENGLATLEYYQMMQDELELIRNSEEPRDIFGMTQDDWDELMTSFDKVMVALDMIGQAWSSINQIQNNKENKQLQAYEKNTQKKKDLLNDQLNKGIISQEQYNARTAKLDADLDKKKEEIAIKQAKRDKALRIFEATINTAAAIAEALPNIPLSIVAGVAGALQIAAIASAPLPAYATGGFTNGDRIYRAGEEGTEWIASNSMVNDPYTGPVIAALEAVRQGKAPASMFGGVTPAFAAMQEVPAYANGGFSNGAAAPVINVPSNDNSALLERVDKLIEQNELLTSFLSDPQNRKAYITNTDLDEKYKEDEERFSIGSIR